MHISVHITFSIVVWHFCERIIPNKKDKGKIKIYITFFVTLMKKKLQKMKKIVCLKTTKHHFVF